MALVGATPIRLAPRPLNKACFPSCSTICLSNPIKSPISYIVSHCFLKPIDSYSSQVDFSGFRTYDRLCKAYLTCNIIWTLDNQITLILILTCNTVFQQTTIGFLTIYSLRLSYLHYLESFRVSQGCLAEPTWQTAFLPNHFGSWNPFRESQFLFLWPIWELLEAQKRRSAHYWSSFQHLCFLVQVESCYTRDINDARRIWQKQIPPIKIEREKLERSKKKKTLISYCIRRRYLVTRSPVYIKRISEMPVISSSHCVQSMRNHGLISWNRRQSPWKWSDSVKSPPKKESCLSSRFRPVMAIKHFLYLRNRLKQQHKHVR